MSNLPTTTQATPTEPGTAHVAIPKGREGYRFVSQLHVPGQDLWWSCLAAYTMISQLNLPVEEKVVKPEIWEKEERGE